MMHFLAWKLLFAVGLSAFVVFPELGSRCFRFAGLALRRVARERVLALTVVGVASFALSAGTSLLVRMPQPFVHDEFSYLLAGDTFSHGRMTNPTHPMWQHFETFHEIQQPTYASKYPPGQGLALAMGQTISGYPIVGVWLSTALACAAVCWMMYGWLPGRWALAGGLVAVFHPVIVEWSQCYWGGSVAMGGGALFLGSLPRILRKPLTRDAVMMGLGMAVLANSRPYEGMMLSLCGGAVLLWEMAKLGREALSRILVRIVLPPLLLILALTFAAIGFYNHRVTGNSFQLPYTLHEATYMVTPIFVWQRPRPEPQYRHEVIRQFHVDLETRTYWQQTSVRGWLGLTRDKYTELLDLHLPTSFRYLMLSVLVVTIPGAVKRDPKVRMALLILGGFLVGTLTEIFMSYRYTAPAISLLLLLILQAMRHLRPWRWGARPIGRSLVRACVLAGVMALVVTNVRWMSASAEGLDVQRWGARRAGTIAQLQQAGPRHLVIVRYGPRHSPHKEWVYNAADIDGSRVVWAREMDSSSNSHLLEYFKDRRVWLLSVDDDTEAPRLVPYVATRPDQKRRVERLSTR